MEFEVTPCLLRSHFKILRSQFIQISEPFDSVLPCRRWFGPKNNDQKQFARKLLEKAKCYTREFIAICVDKGGTSTSKGRGGKGKGKRSGRGRRATQQTQRSISTINVKRNEGLMRVRFFANSAYANFDRNRLWPLHLLSEKKALSTEKNTWARVDMEFLFECLTR